MAYIIYAIGPGYYLSGRVELFHSCDPDKRSVEDAREWMARKYPNEHVFEILPDDTDAAYVDERLAFWTALEA